MINKFINNMRLNSAIKRLRKEFDQNKEYKNGWKAMLMESFMESVTEHIKESNKTYISRNANIVIAGHAADLFIEKITSV